MSESAKDNRSLVIRLPNWVGDAVMATPALRSLRAGHPGARITLVGKPGILKILEGLPYFDAEIALQGRGFRQTLDLAHRLRKGRFDQGLLLPNSFSSALALFLGGVKRRTGYALNGRNFLLSRSLRPVMDGLKRKPSPMTGYYLDLARFAGGKEDSERIELRTRPDLDEKAEYLFRSWGFSDIRPIVGLNPGASFGPSKMWHPQGFAGLSDLVHEKMQGRTVLLCGPGEEAIADEIVRCAVHPLVDTSRKVLPLDLLKSVIARLDGVVTTDTGPRHFAAALGVPVVVVMGPTDPRYTESNLDVTCVLRDELPCSPCHKKVCDTDHRCMKAIDAERAFNALQDLIQGIPA